ncbi:MAG TPA: flagellar hook-length control protein FliK [Caldimonas sp.]
MVANTSLRGNAATTSPVPAIVAVATPSAPDRPAEHDPAAPQRFAELLRQRRADAAPHPSPAPPAAPTAPSPHGDEADAKESPAPTEGAGASKGLRNGPARARAPIAKGATDTAVVENTSHAHEADARQDVDRVDPKSADAAAPAASGAAEPSTAPAQPVADASVCATGVDGRPSRPIEGEPDGEIPTDANRAADATRGALAPRAPDHPRGEAAVDVARASQPLETSRMQVSAAAADPTFRIALGAAEHVGGVRATEPHRDGTFDGLAAAGAIGAFARPAEPLALPTVPTVPTVLTLPTPIDAADFAAALGVKVSVLVHDGVQHAELHLNPAETGPVSIRIEVDGTAARVDFGADLAATRQAIERGLPELASALRDAGLTLAGGGVSQHAGGRAGDERAAAADTRRAIDVVAAPVPSATAARSARRVALGGIDLYA